MMTIVQVALMLGQHSCLIQTHAVYTVQSPRHDQSRGKMKERIEIRSFSFKFCLEVPELHRY